MRRDDVASCDNANHRRTNAPVRHCPTCGEVVNAHAPRHECSESQHAAIRRERSVYCTDCGMRVLFER